MKRFFGSGSAAAAAALVLAGLAAALLSACETDIDRMTVGEVKIDKASLTFRTLGSRSLTAAVYPPDAEEQGVTWTTSDPSKAVFVGAGGAEVDTVTAAAGTVTVRGKAPTEEGQPVIVTVTTDDGGKTAAIPLTILPPPTFAVNVRDLAAGTTAPHDTLESWTGETWTKTGAAAPLADGLVIDGTTASPNSLNALAPGTGQLLYVTEEVLQGSHVPFTWTATLKVSATTPASDNNGIVFGVFGDPTGESLATPFPRVGFMNRNNGAAARCVFTYLRQSEAVDTSTTIGTAALTPDTEYTYEVSWDPAATQFTLRFYGGTTTTSFAPTIIAATSGTSRQIHESLRDPNGAYYPGIWVNNAVVTITSMKIEMEE